MRFYPSIITKIHSQVFSFFHVHVPCIIIHVKNRHFFLFFIPVTENFKIVPKFWPCVEKLKKKKFDGLLGFWDVFQS